MEDAKFGSTSSLIFIAFLRSNGCDDPGVFDVTLDANANAAREQWGSSFHS